MVGTARGLGWVLQPRRAELRRRRAIIAAAPALAARDALKQARWAALIEQALRRRGSGALEARLAARLCVVAFDDALARWMAPQRARRSLDAELVSTWAALSALIE